MNVEANGKFAPLDRTTTVGFRVLHDQVQVIHPRLADTITCAARHRYFLVWWGTFLNKVWKGANAKTAGNSTLLRREDCLEGPLSNICFVQVPTVCNASRFSCHR